MGRGRSKLQLELIENERQRRITFKKRKEGLKKKAYELSTLCGVDVAFVCFDADGQVDTWPHDRRQVRAAFDRYRRGSSSSSSRSPDRRQEIQKVDSWLGSVRDRIRSLQTVDPYEQPSDPFSTFLDWDIEGCISELINQPLPPQLPALVDYDTVFANSDGKDTFLDWDTECSISADVIDAADPPAFAQPPPLEPPALVDYDVTSTQPTQIPTFTPVVDIASCCDGGVSSSV